MASRHPVPVLARGDIGPDAQQYAKKFKEPATVEFAAGGPVDEFAARVKANVHGRIVSAVGAGKSVRMPTELLRCLSGVIVHCTPSMLLAVQLHDYVASISSDDVPCHLVTDVRDEYPSSGLVFTSSATFVGQTVRWRAKKVDPGVTLYMDECHESDSATAVIRDLRTEMPGVSRYYEATATIGSGDRSAAFAAIKLPCAQKEFRYAYKHPSLWRHDESEVPWSLKRVDGHFIYFEDDVAAADAAKTYFETGGVTAFRLHAHMPVDEFRRVNRLIQQSGETDVYALIVDYSFRSGFTFPGLARGIDSGKVAVRIVENGRTAIQYRNACSAEIHQAKARGGRTKSGPRFDYWRPSGVEAANNRVLLEGAEAYLACIYRRLLGFAPTTYLQGTAFSTGQVPKNMLVAMRGKEVLACYKTVEDWPAAYTLELDTSMVGVEPLTAETPVSDVATPLSGVIGGSRPASVFSIDDEMQLPEDGVISDELYMKAKRASMKKRGNERKPRAGAEPPLPAITENLDEIRRRFLGEEDELPENEYLALFGRLGEAVRGDMFPDGLAGVMRSMGATPVDHFFKHAGFEVVKEMCHVALESYNESLATTKSSAGFAQAVRSRASEFREVDRTAFSDWLRMVRDMTVSSATTRVAAFAILRAAPAGGVKAAENGEGLDFERECVAMLGRTLRACFKEVAKGIGAGGESYPGFCEEPPDDYEGTGRAARWSDQYPSLGGKMIARIGGNSVREKVARAVLGNGPVEIDYVKTSDG